MAKTSVVIATFIALWATGATRADIGTWNSNGPFGGWVQALAIDPMAPGTLYVATAPGVGVSKSTDGASSWRPANRGLTGGRSTAAIWSLAIDPQNPATLYAAGVSRVFKSTDGGETWKPANGGLEGESLNFLTIAPTAPDILYGVLSFGGVVRSSDGGAHWEIRSNGLPQSPVLVMVVDSSAPSTVYAATRGEGVFKTTDGGGSWSPINSGLTSSDSRFVLSLAMDPSAPEILYAGTPDGLFKTTNGGGSWNLMVSGLGSQQIGALAIDPVTPSTLYVTTPAGLFRSVDAGASWNRTSDVPAQGGVLCIAIDPESPFTLYAGTFGAGVFKSTDRGETWKIASSGLKDASVRPIAIDPEMPEVMYAGLRGGGVARTQDRGETWEHANQGLKDLFVEALTIDPVTTTTLYAGTHSGVFKSLDAGTTWSASNKGLPSLAVVDSMAIDPHFPATVYVGFYHGGLFKSTNGGARWTQASSGLPNHQVSSLVIDPVTPRTLYAVIPIKGVFKSSDATSTWSSMIPDFDVCCMVMDSADPATLYVATTRSLLKSVDGGSTWTRRRLPGRESAQALAIDPKEPRNLYLGLTDGGVFRSSDAGTTWRSLGFDVWDVFGLAVDLTQPNVVYVGSLGGVFQFTPPPEPPPGPYLASDVMPGFRFKVRISAGDQLIAGEKELDCIGETLCVSGALPGRSELFLRIIGPRPNGFLWTNLVRFTTSRVEVWAEQISTRQINYYELPALPREDTELTGLVDREAFLPSGSSQAAVATIRHRPVGTPGVTSLDSRFQTWASPLLTGRPEPVTFTSDAFPGYRFTVRIFSGSEQQPVQIEEDCIPETICVSGALPGRSELFLRIIGPRPNGFLWTNLVRFTTSRVEVEIEQISTSEAKVYILEEVPRESDQLPGRVDREAFLP